ncbi:MAG TPA: CBS domain-containing protein [Egibacteraceae bacterium]|jgi:CBS domain-containing protein|nr:CBS domain-containing protein [Egibacteraceae bacterium]
MAQALREIMAQDLQTLPATATVDQAARTMRNADVGDIIVVDDDGTVRGIVTDRDITIRAVAEGRDPSTLKLEEIASEDLVTVEPDTDITEAARIMRERAIRRLPVTEGGKPVGIVSIGDLAIERDDDSALADISAAPGDA